MDWHHCLICGKRFQGDEGINMCKECIQDSVVKDITIDDFMLRHVKVLKELEETKKRRFEALRIIEEKREEINKLNRLVHFLANIKDRKLACDSEGNWAVLENIEEKQ